MAAEYSKLADGQDARKEFLAKLPSEVTRIGTNFRLPEGVHQLLVAEMNAFGILIVDGTKGANAGKKFALNLVAGTITTSEGITHNIENTDKAGAKTLAFPDLFFLEMQCSGAYDITINEKGYIKDVVPAELEENVVPAAQVRSSTNKEKKLAF